MTQPSDSIEKKQLFELGDDDPSTQPRLQQARHFDAEPVHILSNESDEEQLAQLLDIDHSAKRTLMVSKRRRWSWLTKSMLLGLIILVLTQTGLSLSQAWTDSPWLFGLYASVLALVILWAGRITFSEWRQLKRLKGIEEAQQVSERLALSMQIGEADPFIERILAKLPTDIDTQNYRDHVRDEHNDAERVLLFESLVLTEIDKKAKKLVHRYATESALLLAASPLAMLDMAIILWRNQKMIRELASCYGIELGYWSRIKLIRSVITNIIYAGASEVVTDIGTQLLSLEVSGKVSTRMAQGLGGGLLTARLGYQTMALCRPVVFSHETRPKLTKIHTALLGELKDFSLAALGKRTTRNKDFTSR